MTPTDRGYFHRREGNIWRAQPSLTVYPGTGTELEGDDGKALKKDRSNKSTLSLSLSVLSTYTMLNHFPLPSLQTSVYA